MHIRKAIAIALIATIALTLAYINNKNNKPTQAQQQIAALIPDAGMPSRDAARDLLDLLCVGLLNGGTPDNIANVHSLLLSQTLDIPVHHNTVLQLVKAAQNLQCPETKTR